MLPVPEANIKAVRPALIRQSMASSPWACGPLRREANTHSAEQKDMYNTTARSQTQSEHVRMHGTEVMIPQKRGATTRSELWRKASQLGLSCDGGPFPQKRCVTTRAEL